MNGLDESTPVIVNDEMVASARRNEPNSKPQPPKSKFAEDPS